MKIVNTENAPRAIGPYSQAVCSSGFVFCSGQIPLGLDGNVVHGGIEEQTVQVMENLNAVLVAAGSGFGKIVKTTIFLDSIDDFSVVNDVYARYFPNENKPARATVEVGRLPKGVLVEIDCIAEL